MHRTALILAALICCAAAPPGTERGGLRFELQAEYRRDALDYDDREIYFTREKIRIEFGESSADITHVYTGKDRNHRFTGSLALRGLTPYFDCVAGHYYANFGAGLIAGRKTYASPDPFTRGPILTRGATFTPSTGGNPLYCFQGLAGGFVVPTDAVTLSVRGFFSYRDRFVRNDIYFPDVTGTSLSSIIARRVKDYRYSDPVVIADYGCVIELSVADRLMVQSYFLYTDIRRSSGRPLLWNYGDRRLPLGEKTFYAYGFFAQYHDDYIRIFIEIGLPSRVVAALSGKHTAIRDYGIAYGLTFSHQACSISFTGKNCGNNFYTPYGAGGSWAESSWLVGIAVRPVRGLSLDGSFYAEKKKSTASTASYLPFLKRERIRVKYDVPRIAYCSIQATAIQDEKKTGPERALRIGPAAGVYIMRSVLISASGTAVRSQNGRWSGSIRTGLSLCLMRFISLSCSYSKYFVSRNDPLYVPTSRRSGSISTGRYVDKSSHIMDCRLSARCRDCRITVRYRLELDVARQLEHGLEVSGRAIF
jgi:hypothetical protein